MLHGAGACAGRQRRLPAAGQQDDRVEAGDARRQVKFCRAEALRMKHRHDEEAAEENAEGGQFAEDEDPQKQVASFVGRVVL